MAPKKEKAQKLTLSEFVNDFSGSWADEVDDQFASGTQPLPPSDRRTGPSSFGGDRYGGYSSIRDNLPQKLPDKPPFTAHLGNLSYEATVETVTDFFQDCNVINVRIIEDREQQRPKGFAYAEFNDLEGLKQALTYDGQTFQGRTIRIKVADPPKGDRYGAADSTRDLSVWERKGPLQDVPSSRTNDRGPREYTERRAPREPMADDGKIRDFGNWERKGPLSPLAQPERPPSSRDNSRAPRMERGGSYRGGRDAAPQWGPGEGRQEGSRPPRREFVERPERVLSAAEKDNAWRSNMRQDVPPSQPALSRDGSEAPPSPATQPSVPASRPKLNLAKRTVSEAIDTAVSSASGDSKASPFGAARPIDTATREKEIEEKRLQAIKEKKDAEEKAKEERRLAKEAADKAAAEKAEADAAAAAEAATAAATAAAAAKDKAEQAEKKTEGDEATNTPATSAAPANVAENEDASSPAANGTSVDTKIPTRPREPREPRDTFKSRATESGNWRRSSADQGAPASRGGYADASRGRGRGGGGGSAGYRVPRNDVPRSAQTNGNRVSGPSQASPTEQVPASPVVDEDGWTTVAATKGRRGPGRPIAS